MDINAIIAERDALRAQLDQAKLDAAFGNSAFIRDNVAVPLDMVRSYFGKSFKVENGKVVATDANGVPILSRERLGEPASFDEAMEILTAQDRNKSALLKSRDQKLTASGTAGGSGAVSRDAFDAMPPDARARHLGAGGTVTDDSSVGGSGARGSKGALSRSAFDALAPAARAQHVRGGGGVHDD